MLLSLKGKSIDEKSFTIRKLFPSLSHHVLAIFIHTYLCVKFVCVYTVPLNELHVRTHTFICTYIFSRTNVADESEHYPWVPSPLLLRTRRQHCTYYNYYEIFFILDTRTAVKSVRLMRVNNIKETSPNLERYM